MRHILASNSSPPGEKHFFDRVVKFICCRRRSDPYALAEHEALDGVRELKWFELAVAHKVLLDSLPEPAVQTPQDVHVLDQFNM